MKHSSAIVMFMYTLICSSIYGGDFTFESKVTYPSDPKPHALVSADFNADGFTDLAMANRDRANVGIYFGNGDNTFDLPVYYPAGGRARDIAVADYNGDGFLDMAVANEASDSISVLINAETAPSAKLM